MNTEDIKRLAELARLELSEEDIIEYQKDFAGILDYISTINSVNIDTYDEQVRGDTTNRMREDSDAYQSGEFTETLLNAAPKREGDYIQVEKIL